MGGIWEILALVFIEGSTESRHTKRMQTSYGNLHGVGKQAWLGVSGCLDYLGFCKSFYVIKHIDGYVLQYY